MSVECRLVRTEEEAQKVFRLRYEIYVARMNRIQPYADHLNKVVIESLDDNAQLIAAFRDSEVVGTVRLNCLIDGNLGYYEDLYRLDELEAVRKSAKIVTKLIARSGTGSRIGAQLVEAAYRQGLAEGVTVTRIDCNEHMLPYFKRLGMKDIGPICHPDYGNVFLMQMDCFDLPHLEKVRSPFATILRDYNHNSNAWLRPTEAHQHVSL
jgi:hypothetical protein